MSEPLTRSTISDAAKGLGFEVLLLAGLLVLAVIGTAFVYGMVWISSKLYPIVEVLSVLGLAVLILNLLPSAIFKGSRRICGNGIVIVSYVWGVSLWMYSILILYQLWGVGGIYLGFITLGVITVPLACVSLLFKGEWSLLGQMVLWVVMVFATRALGLWIISKGEMPASDVGYPPPAAEEHGSGRELLTEAEYEELANLERMGEKSAQNLLDEIETSKNNSLARLIYALGIRFVGERTGQLLAEHFGSLEKLAEATKEELLEVPEVGPKVAESIAEFFSEPANRELIKKLKRAGLNQF